MRHRPWLNPLELHTERASAPGVQGYAQHAARTERALGWVLWISLALVLFITST